MLYGIDIDTTRFYAVAAVQAPVARPLCNGDDLTTSTQCVPARPIHRVLLRGGRDVLEACPSGRDGGDRGHGSVRVVVGNTAQVQWVQ